MSIKFTIIQVILCVEVMLGQICLSYKMSFYSCSQNRVAGCAFCTHASFCSSGITQDSTVNRTDTPLSYAHPTLENIPQL